MIYSTEILNCLNNVLNSPETMIFEHQNKLPSLPLTRTNLPHLCELYYLKNIYSAM